MRLRFALAVALLAAPTLLRAQNRAPAPRVEVSGRVVDAATGAPVAAALIELRDANLKVLSDAQGRFALAGVAPGTHQWVITRMGYAQWDESTEVAEGDEFTIALLARPQTLEGITAVASQIESRRRTAGVVVRTVERRTLELTAAPSAMELVGDHLGVRAVPCRGARGPEKSCAYVRNTLIRPTVFIDEQRAVGGLDDLLNHRAQDLYTVESYSGGAMIRVLTVAFAEQLARGRTMLLPLHFHNTNDGFTPGDKDPDLEPVRP